jgi:hypothetical protein
MTSFNPHNSRGLTNLFFEENDDNPAAVPKKRPRGVGVQGGGIPLRNILNEPSNVALEKEKQRFASAMQRSQYRAYAPKCNCAETCTCGCQNGQPCKCAMTHDGKMKCPFDANARSRPRSAHRPDMQGSRLPHESAVTAFGKDRTLEHRQDYSKYSEIMARKNTQGAYSLPQETNRGPHCPHCRRAF